MRFKHRTLIRKHDVTSDESVEAAFDQVVVKFGRVDICINCAGVAAAKKVLDRENKVQS